MNVRKAQKHMQRATDLMEQGRLGFGVGTKRKINDSVVGDIMKMSSQGGPYFARQIGGTCYLNAVFNMFMLRLILDHKLVEANQGLFDYLKKTFAYNQSKRVHPEELPITNKGDEIIRMPSITSLQQSGTRNLFGDNFNSVFLKLYQIFVDKKPPDTLHDRIDWEHNSLWARSQIFLFTLILLSHFKFTYVLDFSITYVMLDEGEVKFVTKYPGTQLKLIKELKKPYHQTSYIFCREKSRDKEEVQDKLQLCFANHAWLIDTMPSRFAGSIVTLGKKAGEEKSSGHAVMCYPYNSRVIGKILLVKDSNKLAIYDSRYYDLNGRKPRYNIFVYAPSGVDLKVQLDF